MALLALLSLVSSVQCILPDNSCPQYLHGSLLYENESPETCKATPGIETPARNKRVFHQPVPANGPAAPAHNTGAALRLLSCWARPAYYDFLHRFNLF